jgi:hypothetical protein
VNVYVASSQHEHARAQAVMARARAAGCTVTHDWTVEVTTTPATTDAERYDAACADHMGVVDADAIIVLGPERKDWGCAMWTELGIALAMGKLCIVVGGERNIFSHLCIRALNDDVALQILEEYV